MTCVGSRLSITLENKNETYLYRGNRSKDATLLSIFCSRIHPNFPLNLEMCSLWNEKRTLPVTEISINRLELFTHKHLLPALLLGWNLKIASFFLVRKFFFFLGARLWLPLPSGPVSETPYKFRISKFCRHCGLSYGDGVGLNTHSTGGTGDSGTLRYRHLPVRSW